MSKIPPEKLAGLPNGVFVVGVAVGDFTLKNIVTGKGQPMTFVEGQVLAGQTFCAVSHRVETGEQPYLPVDGDPVRAFVVPDFKANNVFRSSVKLARPAVLVDGPAKK